MIRLKLFGESAGTALLIYLGTGLVIFGGPYTDLLGPAMGWGLALAVLVYTFGPLSGAHFNPAVTLTMFLTKRMSGKEAGQYVGAQLVGGLLGELLVVLTYKSVLHQTGQSWEAGVAVNNLNATVFPNLSVGMAFLTEVVLTTILLVVVLVLNNKKLGVNGAQGALVVGFTIFILVMVGGNLTGASMNPVRSLFPAMFAGGLALSSLWLYLTAPFVGAGIAVLIDKYILSTDDVIGGK
jgi:aquaporin Z